MTEEFTSESPTLGLQQLAASGGQVRVVGCGDP